ncbi:MAG: hypothetical protein AABZ14_07880 [Candidatus Margulisiibacteriota bacterium]
MNKSKKWADVRSIANSFVQVSALYSMIFASIILVMNPFSPEQIATVSGTYWDFNMALLTTLSLQSANNQIAISLILFSFILQLTKLTFLTKTWDDVLKTNLIGIMLALIVCSSIVYPLFLMRDSISKQLATKAEIILKERAAVNKK